MRSALIRSISPASAPDGARDSPVPNSASTHASGRGRSPACSYTGMPQARARARFATASGCLGALGWTIVQRYRPHSSRAHAVPSPPLPPVPQAKYTAAPSGSSPEIASANACAARSMTANRRHAALAEPLFLRPAHRAGGDEPAHGSPSSQVRAHSARAFFPIIAHQRGGRQILKTQDKPPAVAGKRRICAFQRVQPTTRRPWRGIRGSTSNAFMRRGCR